MTQAWKVKAIQQQLDWIKEHGQTMSGYIARYGSRYDKNHYGQGGEAIYRADVEHLDKLMTGRWPS